MAKKFQNTSSLDFTYLTAKHNIKMADSHTIIREIAASAHIISVKQLLSHLADINEHLHQLLVSHPADFGPLELTISKNCLSRARDTLSLFGEAVKSNDVYYSVMMQWQKDTLDAAMVTAEERKLRTEALVELLDEIVSTF